MIGMEENPDLVVSTGDHKRITCPTEPGGGGGEEALKAGFSTNHQTTPMASKSTGSFQFPSKKWQSHQAFFKKSHTPLMEGADTALQKESKSPTTRAELKG